jgi:hypothetical protein
MYNFEHSEVVSDAGQVARKGVPRPKVLIEKDGRWLKASTAQSR